MNFTVREAQPPDQHSIVKAQLAMAMESEELKLNESTLAKGVEAVFSDPTKGQYWIAETDSNEIAGCLLCVPEWSDWRNATVLWIHSVYTWPTFRKQGVYKKLYSHLKAKVEGDSKYAGLRLYVEKQNLSAETVYQKLGMSSEHYNLYEWLKPS